MDTRGFYVDDLVKPIAERFNNSVQAFIIDLKKEIGFHFGVGIFEDTTYHHTGMIECVNLMDYSGKKKKLIQIFPKTSGRFDLKCLLESNGSVKFELHDKQVNFLDFKDTERASIMEFLS